MKTNLNKDLAEAAKQHLTKDDIIQLAADNKIAVSSMNKIVLGKGKCSDEIIDAVQKAVVKRLTESKRRLV